MKETLVILCWNHRSDSGNTCSAGHQKIRFLFYFSAATLICSRLTVLRILLYMNYVKGISSSVVFCSYGSNLKLEWGWKGLVLVGIYQSHIICVVLLFDGYLFAIIYPIWLWNWLKQVLFPNDLPEEHPLLEFMSSPNVTSSL